MASAPTSAPRSPTSAASWAMPVGCDQQQEDTKTAIIVELLPMVKKDGGPAQFVRKLLEARPRTQEYAMWLWHTFPEDASHHYEYGRELPTTDESNQAMMPPLCLHPAARPIGVSIFGSNNVFLSLSVLGSITAFVAVICFRSTVSSSGLHLKPSLYWCSGSCTRCPRKAARQKMFA